MSITNYRNVQQVNDTANKNLLEEKKGFRSEIEVLEQEKADILQQARRVLEQQAVEKLSQDIHGDGKQ